MSLIYFDHNATTPLVSEVAAAMRVQMDQVYGNPSSTHWAGQNARLAIDRARGEIAALLHCQEAEVVLTSGGTEANNAALAGVFFAWNRPSTPHFLISGVEHPSITKTCNFLARLGAQVTRVPVDRYGEVDPEDVRRALQPNTALVSVMHSNNEVGTLQPIQQISAVAHERGALMHTDAAQSAGKVPLDVRQLDVDLLSVAGHKMYAPQGVGALYIRHQVHLEPLLHGAGHEQGRRAGTENVLEIVGLGVACNLALRTMDVAAMTRLRDYFWQRLQERFSDRVVLNGHPSRRLPNTLNVSFPGHLGHEILAHMPAVAASTGSACHEGHHQPSPVLAAMGLPDSVAQGAIRFSLGRNSSPVEVDSVVEQLMDLLHRRQGMDCSGRPLTTARPVQ